MIDRRSFAAAGIGSMCIPTFTSSVRGSSPGELVTRCRSTIRAAADYFAGTVASHGGYVYFYTPSLDRRWGEGEATVDQVWVQPPGTPTVGSAYVDAFNATGDPLLLSYAVEAAGAMVAGQLNSGGWTNCVDFDPAGKRTADYRRLHAAIRDTRFKASKKPRRPSHSSLDDDQTTAVLRFLMDLDRAITRHRGAVDTTIRETLTIGLTSMLDAQHAIGSFPQVWDGPVENLAARPASYPTYDWRTENRIKAYWDLPTLNDNVAGNVASVLIKGWRTMHSRRCFDALKRLANFLVLAQMPEPQPAWAQQYTPEMHPAWARKFEPPAISGHETADAIETLIEIARVTRNARWLEPIPAALRWMRRSELPPSQTPNRDNHPNSDQNSNNDDHSNIAASSNGGKRLSRYYELRTNRPMYMTRRGKQYDITYDAAEAVDHYSFSMPSPRMDLETRYRQTVSALNQASARQPNGSGQPNDSGELARPPDSRVRQIFDAFDGQRWLSVGTGERLVGQNRFAPGERYLSSAVFAENVRVLAQYVASFPPTTQ